MYVCMYHFGVQTNKLVSKEGSYWNAFVSEDSYLMQSCWSSVTISPVTCHQESPDFTEDKIRRCHRALIDRPIC